MGRCKDCSSPCSLLNFALAISSVAAEEVSLRGTVTVSGVALPDARIEVRGAGPARVEWSGKDGTWRMEGLPSGQTLRITADSNGCVPAEKQVTLQDGGAVVDFELTLKNLRETVVVTDGLLSVRSDAPEKSQTITSEQFGNCHPTEEG